MNIPDFGTTASEGTAVFHFSSIWPWPPIKPFILSELMLSDGLVRLTALSSGQIHAANIETHEGPPQIISEGTTCPLIADGPFDLKLAITWRRNGFAFAANGQMLGNTNGPLLNELHIDPKNPRQIYDYQGENGTALTRRRDRLVGFQPPPKRKRGDTKYAFRSLDDEARQLEDLLTMLKAGRLHHVPGLAARLRSLIAIGTPLPLLQNCAARKNRPLIAYTYPDEPDYKPPHRSLYSLSGPSIAPNRTSKFNNPIDIDVWLDQIAFSIGHEAITHRFLIKKTGDTIGNHLDLEIIPAVALLRSTSQETQGIRRELLLEYLGSVAATTLHLCRDLLTAD